MPPLTRHLISKGIAGQARNDGRALGLAAINSYRALNFDTKNRSFHKERFFVLQQTSLDNELFDFIHSHEFFVFLFLNRDQGVFTLARNIIKRDWTAQANSGDAFHCGSDFCGFS